MKKGILTLLICAAILACGVAVVLFAVGWRTVASAVGTGLQEVGTSLASHPNDATAEAKANGENPNTRVPNVNIQILHAETLEDILNLTGTIEPWKDVVLSAETPGKIEWKGADVGLVVKEGDVLFRVDTESLQAMLDQAQAQFKLTEQDLDRNKRLLDRGVSTPQKQDSAVANHDVAEANLRSLQIRVRKSVVKAPFDCTIDHVFMKKDEFTDVGKPLVRLVQLGKVKVILGVPEMDVLRFKVGDSVHVKLDALPDRPFTGLIHEIAPTADMVTHTFRTEIEVDNADGLIKPGMIARVELVRGTYPNSIVIPIFASALVDNKRVVFVEKDGKAEIRTVETGIVQGSIVQITKGLAPGDHLIATGQRDIRPGESVKVQESHP